MIAAPASPPAAPVAIAPIGDASAAACRAVRGPIELPLRAPSSLVVRQASVDLVQDDEGRPELVTFAVTPVTPSSALPPRETADGSAPRAPRPPRAPCAIAGDLAFCPDPTGAVHRARLTGEEDRIVASSRTGSRVGAAPFPGGHAALGYLASRKTTEGWVSEAWLLVDDDPPVRLSEDGSGATAIQLEPRGASVLALTVDARTALTALHTRVVGFGHPARMGEDAVIFVGGPGDHRTAAALAIGPVGPAWALLPIARDTLDFGLATVRVDDPPRVDEPVLWSMYPNGLDPAAVAAAAGGGHTWVARVRPEAAAPGSAHILEVGELTTDGYFAPRAVVPTGNAPADVALAIDGHGALWLSWVDAAGGWLERLACR
ncbi:MAG TPA: hypothetical protein VHV30_15285 [Polyangiaceae bacterium]|nr:hypothetical protein [Polyangiaceae bacterium]